MIYVCTNCQLLIAKVMGDTHNTHMNACKVTSQTKAILETQGGRKLLRFLLANCFL